MFPLFRVKSDFELGQSLLTPKDISSEALNKLVPAVCIFDDNMSGAWSFTKECLNNGIQPIISLSVQCEVAELKAHGVVQVVAKNSAGFTELTELSSSLALGQRKATLDELSELKDVFFIMGGPDAIWQNQSPENVEILARMVSVLDCYIGLQRTKKNEYHDTVDQYVAQIGHMPLVATPLVQYGRNDDYMAADALLCIVEGRYMSEVDRKKINGVAFDTDFSELYSDVPHALENTFILAKKASSGAAFRSPELPKFSTDEKAQLAELARNGLIEKGALHEERLAYELSVIDQMGFNGYFLIVADFINFAKSKNIPVGPGRGSGAGSIVAYGLGITDVDPIKYGLMFERFLNPDRVSMPDFDIDFHKGRRNEVIDYVKSKYGQEKVGHIASFGRLMPRAAVKGAGRALNIPLGLVEKISGSVPFNPSAPITLSEALKSSEFEELLKDETVRRLCDLALKLEGRAWNCSTHAAGIVLSKNNLSNYAPVKLDENGEITLGLEMKAAEAAGLVKFDFLGIQMLDVLQEAMPDKTSWTYEDPKVFEYINKTNFGLFQIESEGMKNAIYLVKPNSLGDVAVLISLYRPGPMEFLSDYAARKNGEMALPDYPEVVQDVLKETHGVIVYQEQVMEIVQKMAGYTLAQADILRRVMGKKNREEMQKHEEIFVTGAMKNGFDEKTSLNIFKMLASFADYGFNKSHAYAYAQLTYQSAYAALYHKVEFFKAWFNNEIQDTSRLTEIKIGAREAGIKILRPTLQSSSHDFKVENDGIRWALPAIKNVSKNDAHAIIEARDSNPDSFSAWISLLKNKVNKKALSSLIYAGAFDFLELPRAHMLSKVVKSDQTEMFETILPEMELDEKLKNEFKVLGFFLTNHPTLIAKRTNQVTLDKLVPGKNKVIAFIESIDRKNSRNGNKFIIMRINDHTKRMELFADFENIKKYKELQTVTLNLYVKKENNVLRVRLDS